MSGLHNLMCGECGGEVFKIVVEGSPNCPSKLVLACVKPSCSGAIEVEISIPRIELSFGDKSRKLISSKLTASLGTAIDELVKASSEATWTMESTKAIESVTIAIENVKKLRGQP